MGGLVRRISWVGQCPTGPSPLSDATVAAANEMGERNFYRYTTTNHPKKGMLYEFDAQDGKGKRSSLSYANSGFRPNMINHVVLLTSGYWQDGPMADECLALMQVGAPDLFYKLDQGYFDDANGKAKSEPLTIDHPGWDFHLLRALWEETIEPYHQGRRG